MLKVFAASAIAVLAGHVLIWALPAGWGGPSTVAFAVLMLGLFVYAIAHPKSQFFAPVVCRLATDEPLIALTFDDGPDPVFTPRILDILRAHRARATFFVVGERAREHPDLIRRMHDEGHTVGTHTQRHRLSFHFGSPAEIQREIEDAIAVVAAILPVRPKLFRPPQGVRSPSFASGWGRTRDLTCVTWSARALDSRPTTAAAIVARLEKRLEPGAIITLHDGTGFGGGTDREPTLDALDTLLARCETLHLRCVALSEVGTART